MKAEIYFFKRKSLLMLDLENLTFANTYNSPFNYAI